MTSHNYSYYRTRVYYRHFRRIGMPASAAWMLAQTNL